MPRMDCRSCSNHADALRTHTGTHLRLWRLGRRRRARFVVTRSWRSGCAGRRRLAAAPQFLQCALAGLELLGFFLFITDLLLLPIKLGLSGGFVVVIRLGIVMLLIQDELPHL